MWIGVIKSNLRVRLWIRASWKRFSEGVFNTEILRVASYTCWTDYSAHVSPTSIHPSHPSQQAADSKCNFPETSVTVVYYLMLKKWLSPFKKCLPRFSKLSCSIPSLPTQSDHTTPPSPFFFSLFCLSVSCSGTPSESFSPAVLLVSLRAGLQFSDSIRLTYVPAWNKITLELKSWNCEWFALCLCMYLCSRLCVCLYFLN